jgi:hypothetical protein
VAETTTEKWKRLTAAPAVKTLPLDGLVEVREFQPREHGVDEDHALAIAQAYEAGEAVDRPRVWFVGGQHLLTRGYHRKAGAAKAGLTELEVEVVAGGTHALAELDALVGNNHKVRHLTAREKHKVVLRLYDLGVLPKDASATWFAAEVGVHRKTVERWLRDHDAARAETATRTTSTGRVVNTGNQHTTPSLFDQGEGGEEGGEEGGGKVAPPAGDKKGGKKKGGEGKPKAGPAAGGYDGPLVGHGGCVPNADIMPHKRQAEEIALAMRSVKARMEQVRADMRRLFKDIGTLPAAVIPRDLCFDAKFDPTLSALIDDVRSNLFDHICPACAGFGQDEAEARCRHCEGYGFVTATVAAGLKGAWKKSTPRYEKLAKAAAAAALGGRGDE